MLIVFKMPKSAVWKAKNANSSLILSQQVTAKQFSERFLKVKAITMPNYTLAAVTDINIRAKPKYSSGWMLQVKCLRLQVRERALAIPA